MDNIPPTPAETVLNKGLYAAAEPLFRAVLEKAPASEGPREGLVRALLGQDKLDDAAKEAEDWVAKSPQSSMAMVALGDVRLRQGDLRGALAQFQKAAHADACNALAYFGAAKVDGLAGLHATAKRLIEQAYALHPSDDSIQSWWISTRKRKERLANWTDYAEHSDQITDEERAKLKTRLEKDKLYHASDCRAAPATPQQATVQMARLTDGATFFLGWGLDVQFNGKRRRLQIDTGASGITISRAAALGLGIIREDATVVGGIGDKAVVKTSVTHVASVKIGGMEFTNCSVDILEKWSVLDTDGLIGGDVFDAYALTLDFPKHELRVAPLPERPGEKKPEKPALETAGDEDVEPEARDAYVAPEMAQWERIYRSGHELLMPTGLVDTKHMKDQSAWKEKLFMLDTGSFTNLISPEAASEVTKVSRDRSAGVHGVQGEVEKVFDAGRFTLQFGGLRLDSQRTTAIDMTSISHGAGVQVSGLIGATALFQVALHIDYRDNLVWCEYTPPK